MGLHSVLGAFNIRNDKDALEDIENNDRKVKFFFFLGLKGND